MGGSGLIHHTVFTEEEEKTRTKRTNHQSQQTFKPYVLGCTQKCTVHYATILNKNYYKTAMLAVGRILLLHPHLYFPYKMNVKNRRRGHSKDHMHALCILYTLVHCSVQYLYCTLLYYTLLYYGYVFLTYSHLIHRLQHKKLL